MNTKTVIISQVDSIIIDTQGLHTVKIKVDKELQIQILKKINSAQCFSIYDLSAILEKVGNLKEVFIKRFRKKGDAVNFKRLLDKKKKSYIKKGIMQFNFKYNFYTHNKFSREFLIVISAVELFKNERQLEYRSFDLDSVVVINVNIDDKSVLVFSNKSNSYFYLKYELSTHYLKDNSDSYYLSTYTIEHEDSKSTSHDSAIFSLKTKLESDNQKIYRKQLEDLIEFKVTPDNE